MSTGKHFDRVCALVLALCLVLTVLLYSADSLGIQAVERELGYESRLFASGTVHTVDIVMDDWDGFLETAQSEEYTLCDVVIDGDSVRGVGIRGKGNTSLSQVAAMDSQRYSFKIEFDHYDSSKSYHGLDKLCLNNLIQDNTMMKDYLVYQLMGQFGAEVPLCSFVFVTVNGQDWGLYLAVEGIEDGFLQRNYGSDHGALYKPDSLSMGGGRGNGRDFDIEDWQDSRNGDNDQTDRTGRSDAFGGFGGGTTVPDGMTAPGTDGDVSSMPGGMEPPEGFTMPDGSEMPQSPDGFDLPEDFDFTQMFGDMGGFGGGMGSSDVKLQYIDDDTASYSNIFDSAKTDVSAADEQRLIQSLKLLSQGDSSAVDVESVLRYFTVHNFVVNGDSYTGSMVHNYYLYEKDGKLSMLPWDYNLAFGTFQGGSASSAVNDDIDAPLSCTGSGDRPMMDWILNDPDALARYHQYLADFLEQFDLESMIRETASMIAPYVERDPTRFCTVEEYESGVEALVQFCTLRSESVRRQLADDDTPVDTGDLVLSDMGTMSTGGGDFAPGGMTPPDGFSGGFSPDQTDGAAPQPPTQSGAENGTEVSGRQPGQGQTEAGDTASGDGRGQGGDQPTFSPTGTEQSDPSQLPEGSDTPQMPDGQTEENGSSPFDGQGMQRPEGQSRDDSQMPEQSRGGGISQTALLLAGSLAALLAGLLIAWRFRR